MVDRTIISQAHDRIRDYVRRTPVIEVEPTFGGFGFPLHCKLELLQHTASFKPRGAFNRMLSCAVPHAGVIAASGGNHGAAVAFAARRLGFTAEIFVPESAPLAKVSRIRGYDAKVTLFGKNYQDALSQSLHRQNETGALNVHAYDQPEVVAGQGTIGLEWEQQCPNLDTLLVAVGGGGLLAGIAAWYGSNVKLIGVEPQDCPTWASAKAAGRPVDVATSGIAADSLGASRIGVLPFEILQKAQASSIVVSQDSILKARKTLWDELRLVTEFGGATALAAIVSGQLQPKLGERIGVLICGANTSVTDGLTEP